MTATLQNADYIRCHHMICDSVGHRTAYKSINQAKRASRELQASGKSLRVASGSQEFNGIIKRREMAEAERRKAKAAAEAPQAAPTPTPAAPTVPEATSELTSAAQDLADSPKPARTRKPKAVEA